MNVLHLIDSGGVYGAEMMLLDLMDEQKRRGVVPVLGSIRNRRSEPKDIEAEASRRGHRVMSWPLKWGVDVAGARRISEYAVREGIELLHTHGYKADIHAGVVIRKKAHVSWVTTLHGWTATKRLSALYFYEILDGLMVRCADRVVSVSPGIRERWPLFGLPQERFEVIPNGIRCGFGFLSRDQAEPEIRDFCSKGFVIGSIGRLSREKNYALLVESLAEIVQGQLDVRAVIIGSGEERSRLLALAGKLGVGDRFFLPGYKKDARRYLPFFDVFILTSLTEGLPISLLEAMDAGIPVVAPDVGDVGSLLENGTSGIVYGKGNRREFVSHLRVLCREPALREKYSAKGRARVREHYTTEAMTSSYLKLYEEVCRQGNGRMASV